MDSQLIPVNVPDIREEDVAAVTAEISAGWISGESPTIELFEEAICSSTNRKHGIAVSNGSDALELAIASLDLPKGSEVIVPSFTIISCLLPILRLGLTPVFIDSTPGNWNMESEDLESALSSKTAAIMIVHIYGMSSNIPKILDFAQTHNLAVIEDASEALGQMSYGKKCGSIGLVSTLSFYANKNVTTGEGGMVLTDDARLAQKLRSMRNLTFRPERRFVHDSLGWNMRLSSMQAALGLSQASRVDEAIQRRVSIARTYIEALGANEFLEMQPMEYEGGMSTFWVVGIVLRGHPSLLNASEAMTALGERGVGTRPFFHPLHKQPLFETLPFDFRVTSNMESSEHLGTHGFYVPNGLGLSESQLGEAVQRVTEVLGV